MPSRRPLVSIVTSSYNQGTFIGRTIESVLAQDYPAIEHIVVDGMSTDGTAGVLASYPHLKVIREPDCGQADAINKGFKLATGEILCFLNSDDTFEPGALSAVADAIDPANGRHVVLGRCRFVDERDRSLGVEHPSGFEGHRRVLEIWKGHLLPQPAIFWTRGVWDTCGPLNVDDRLMLDYDLFCRFSSRYRFWPIDRILANYRMHMSSKTSSITDAERLEQAIAVSRRYWGSPFAPQYWQIRASYAAFRFDRRPRAVCLMRAGRADYVGRQRARGVARIAAGAAMAPDVVLDVLVVPVLRPIADRIWRGPLRPRRALKPQTKAWLSRTDLHDDGWAGPTWAGLTAVPGGASALVLIAATVRAGLTTPLVIEAFIDGRSLGRQSAGDGEQFAIRWPLESRDSASSDLRLVASTFFVADDHFANHDFRPLAYRPSSLAVEIDGSADRVPLTLRPR